MTLLYHNFNNYLLSAVITPVSKLAHLFDRSRVYGLRSADRVGYTAFSHPLRAHTSWTAGGGKGRRRNKHFIPVPLAQNDSFLCCSRRNWPLVVRTGNFSPYQSRTYRPSTWTQKPWTLWCSTIWTPSTKNWRSCSRPRRKPWVLCDYSSPPPRYGNHVCRTRVAPRTMRLIVAVRYRTRVGPLMVPSSRRVFDHVSTEDRRLFTRA